MHLATRLYDGSSLLGVSLDRHISGSDPSIH